MHFSRPKGATPKRAPEVKRSRGLAWYVVDWARFAKPRMIFVENVEEFIGWGPLLADGTADPARAGETFSAWIQALRQAGYRVEWRKLGACEFGAQTVRSRLFIIARADGKPIVWPQPTHGPGRQAYRSGGDCADWSLPAHSILLSPKRARALGCRRPLAQATLHRIAQGMKRHGADDHAPFTVPSPDRAPKDTAGDAPQRAQRAKRIEALCARTSERTRQKTPWRSSHDAQPTASKRS